MSVITNSPLLPPIYWGELTKIARRHDVSQDGFNAALEVASRTPPMLLSNFAIIESTDRPTDNQRFQELPRT